MKQLDLIPNRKMKLVAPTRKRKPSLAEAACAALGDPLGVICTLGLCLKYWKVALILLAVLAAVGLITGLVILWASRWDI